MVERVRVTGPPRHPTSVRRPAASGTGEGGPSPTGSGGESAGGESGDGVDEVYLTSLLREQLALAARVGVVLVATVGLVPLVFHLAPDLAERDIAGLPAAWVLLGALVHPLLLVLGWRYVRRAERNEQVYADLLDARAGQGEP